MMMLTAAGDPVVEIAISVLDADIASAIDHAVSSAPHPVVIIHQITDPTYRWTKPLPDHVRYVVSTELGLAASRNRALDEAIGDIIVLADGDTTLWPGAIEGIVEAYRRHRDAAAITFRSSSDTRWDEDFVHNWRTVGQIYSLITTYRPDWLRHHQVRFDERFGLGALYPQGEENILLADIRRRGGMVVGCPERIIDDPGPTSGDVFTPDRITTKVVVARRMYGWLAGAGAALAFFITKRDHYRHSGVTVRSYWSAAWRGLRADLNTD